MDIASLGFAIDSSQSSQAAANLDRMVQSATQAQQAQSRLQGSSAGLEAQMRALVAVAQSQTGILAEIGKGLAQMGDKAAITTTALAGLARGSESATKAMGGLSGSMVAFSKSADDAWKAAEKLDDAFESMGTALGASSGLAQGLTSVVKGMQDLKTIAGTTVDQILSTNRALDQLKLGNEQSAVSFTRVTQILSDNSDATKAYKERIEAYIGSIKGLSNGEVVAKLTSALAATTDGAQKTADAMQLLGVQGAEGLRKINDAGKQVYTDEMKRLDQLQAELLRRQQAIDADRKKRADEQSKSMDGQPLSAAIKDLPIIGAIANQAGIVDLMRLYEINLRQYIIKPMEKFFTLTDEARVKIALINQESQRVWEDSRGFFGSIAGYFDSIYVKYSNLIKLALGTYQVKFTTNYKLEDNDPFGAAKNPTPQAAPASVADQRAGRQFVSQFDSTLSATLKFADGQKQANELLDKGVISVSEYQKALTELGQQYTRATGQANPFLESLTKANADVAAAAAAAHAARQEAINAMDADIEAARAKVQTFSDLLAGVLPGGTRSLARSGERRAQAVLLTEEDKQQLARDVDFAEQAAADLDRELRAMEESVRRARPSEAVKLDTKALEKSAVEIEVLTQAIERFGVEGDDAGKRTVTMWKMVNKEFGDKAAVEFLTSRVVPEALEGWVAALDAVSAAQKRMAIERAALSSQNELDKLNMTVDAYKKGPEAIAANEQAMKLLTTANQLGFESFERLAAAFPTFADKLKIVTAAANDAKVVLDSVKRAVDAAKAAQASWDVADLGVRAPAIIERARIEQDVARNRDAELAKLTPGPSQARTDVMAKAEEERVSRLSQIEAQQTAAQNAAIFQQQMRNDIARAQARVATADPGTQQQAQARIDTAQQMLSSIKNEGDLARVRDFLRGKTVEMTDAERQYFAVARDTAKVNRGAEISRYAKELDTAAEAARRLAAAEQQGPAAVRQAQAQNRVAAAPADVRGLTAAAELKNEITELGRIVGEYEGKAQQAAKASGVLTSAIADGAGSAQEFALAQAKYNIELQVGKDIQGDSIEMINRRKAAIEAATAALDKQTIAEGNNKTVQQTAIAQQQLKNLQDYNTALAAGGVALGQVVQAQERNQIALANYSTTFEKLGPAEKERVKTLQDINAAINAQAKATAALNSLQKDKDDLEVLQTEISLIGKSDRERQIAIATMRLEQEERRELNTLIGQEGKEVDAAREKIRASYEERKTLIAASVEGQIKKADLEKEAQLWTDIWKNAVTGIQSSFAGFFESVLSGGTKTWGDLADSLKKVMFQVIAQIAAAMVFRPIIGNILGGLGASPDFMRSLGLGSYAGDTGSDSSGGFLGPLGNAGSIVNNVGKITGNDFLGSIGESLGFGGSSALPSAVGGFNVGGTAALSSGYIGADLGVGLADLSIGGLAGETFGGLSVGGGALGGLGVDSLALGGLAEGAGGAFAGAAGEFAVGGAIEAGTAALGGAATAATGLMATIGAVIPYVGIAIGAFSLLSSLFKRKPSNEGAETSFSFYQTGEGSDFTFEKLFEGTKHPASMARTNAIAATLETTIKELGDRYKDVRFEGTFGANYGKKEGTSIFYGAPDITEVSQRSVFKFDPEKQDEVVQALADFSLAALKGADWSGMGETVATAVKNSTAASLADFAKDVDFAEKFQDVVDFMNKGWDPVNSQMAQIKKTAEDAGNAVADQITNFLDKTKELWPDVVQSFDAAGNEITSVTREVTETLTGDFRQSNSEAEAMGNTLMDASGNYYTFTGQIGDATLELTNSAGEVVTATYDAATGVYELTRSVTDLGGAAGDAASQVTTYSQQHQDASLAVKNYALGVAGLNDTFRYVLKDGVETLEKGVFATAEPLRGLDLALEIARQGVENLRPAFEAAGATAAEIAILIPAAMEKALADTRAAFANAQIASTWNWTSAFNPSAVPTAQQAFASVGATRDATPAFFDALNDFFLKAGAGAATQADYTALTPRFINQDSYDILTDQQLSGLFSQVGKALQNSLATQQARAGTGTNQQNGSSGIDNSSGGGGGGGGSDDGGAKKALQEQITALNNNSRELKSWADQFGRLSTQLLDFRKSLLLGPLTPLTPEQQLKEARSQFEDALVRANSTDKETAVKGMQDLQGASQSLLEKSRAYYASSAAYQEDFDKVQKALLDTGNKAKSIEQQQLEQLEAVNVNLEKLQEDLDKLNTPSTPTGGGGGDGGGTTPTVPTGQDPNKFPYIDQGIKFGVQSMGRLLTENAETFMKRRFTTSAYSGPYTEDAAYDWMQQQHPSGIGLTRNQYYAAATKGGFVGQFGGSAHLDFLNADKTGAEWSEFILNLRNMGGTVKPGLFKTSMATGMPDWIYAFDKGGVTQFGNVVSFPQRQGSIARGPTLMPLMGGRGAVAGELRDEVIMPLMRTASGEMGVSSGGGDGHAAAEIRRMIAQNGSAYPEMIGLLRLVASRLDDLGNIIRRKAA